MNGKLISIATILLIAASSIIAATATKPADTSDTFNGRVENYPRQLLKPGRGTIALNITIPKGFHSTKEAPITFNWRSDNSKIVSFLKDSSKFDFKNATYPISIPVKGISGKTELTIDASLFFCKNGSTVCQFDFVRLKIPVEVSASGSTKLPITVDAVAKGTRDDL